jgi:hypothetical protein
MLRHSYSYLVQYIGKNNRGKHSLSRKNVLEARLKGDGKSTGSGPSKRSSPPKDPPSAEMKKEEVDVIAQAIESVEELN